jgi:hypothetical protein
MQKVVGSSPIIRLKGSPASAGRFRSFVAMADNGRPLVRELVMHLGADELGEVEDRQKSECDSFPFTTAAS